MVVFEHGVLLTQLIVNLFLTRIPQKEMIVVQRQEYIESIIRGETEHDQELLKVIIKES